jgi:hypothetical protein
LILLRRKWVALALAIIALALAVQYLHSLTRYPSLPYSAAPTAATSRATTVEVPKIGNEIALIQAAKGRGEKQRNDKSIKTVTASSEIDESFVGQPFTISASIEEGCKSDTIECPLVMASVGKMVKEPRDVQWATKMEATIQSAFDSQGSGKYAIRNVECRTSLCILEVEVHVLGPVVRYEDAIFSRLRPNAMTIGVNEYDASGASFLVELMDFERR